VIVIPLPARLLRKDYRANFFIGDMYARWQRARALHIYDYDVERLTEPAWVIRPDTIAWLRGRSYTASIHHKQGDRAKVFLAFEDQDDALLFKLTWGGA
jgi:hypothetical protein